MKTSQKGFVIPLLITIVILAIAGVGIYLHTQNKPQTLPVQNTPVQTPPVQNTPINLPPANQQGVSAVINGNNQFAFNLYEQLKQSNSGNIFFSPYSLNNAFAMVYEGAKGATASQIQSVFGFPADSGSRQSSFESINNDLNQAGASYQLSIANALWVEKEYSLLKSYTDVVAQVYGGNASPVDFIASPQAAVDTINAWVAGKTNDKIPNLLSIENVNPNTRLVLTDAIYFKGKWTDAFDPNNTDKTASFYSDGNRSVTVEKTPMMSKTNDKAMFNYADNGTLQVLEMPYKGNKLLMLILLPKTDLSSVEGSLSADFVSQLRTQLKYQRVDAYIPKFTFKTSYGLNDTLKKMGIVDAFSGSADFSGITDKDQLEIDSVIHQAYIAVDEQGTEAAAATAIGIATSAIMEPINQPPEFRADHPFIFMIEDTQSGNILFIGRVVKP